MVTNQLLASIARLEAENARLHEALRQIQAASEFYSKAIVSDDTLRYAHESTFRLADAALYPKGESERLDTNVPIV